jgi:hypothetical protein
MQQVDPFVPVAARRPRPHTTVRHLVPPGAKPVAGQPASEGTFVEPERRVYTNAARLRDALSTHRAAPQPGVNSTPSPGAPHHIRPQQVPRAARQPAPRQATDAAAHATKKGRRFARALQPLFIIFGAIAVGLLIQSLQVGEIVIVLYGIFALLRRIKSRITFTLALFSLLSIIILLVIRPNNQLAANFAVYTFLLLVVGTVTLGREIHAANA